MRTGMLGAALCSIVLVGACAQPSEKEVTAAAVEAGWREVTGSPLSPRDQALGLWTGREVLLFGGSDLPPCSDTSSCAMDPTPLSDSAALDPDTNRWRPLRTAPVPVLGAFGAVVGSKAFLLPYGSKREILVYDVDGDSWKRLPAPFDSDDGYRLVAAGERLIAYAGTDELRPLVDQVLDVRTGKWSALPADPLGPAWDRTMVWTGREVALFDHKLVPNPGADGPALTRGAVLDLTSGGWRTLPEAPMLSTGPWFVTGDRLVNPLPSSADGGRINGWGRSYPDGGIVRPSNGAWTPLPDPPERVAGVHDGTDALYLDVAGSVLDTRTGSWRTLPRPPVNDSAGSPTVVAAGARMLVFGGARNDQTLTNATWIWTP
ncbi:hypothetical protein KOI35_14845 [Actinoplanes bogorensis]|uniref:Galactose oxidase n=1 Tax=Paractinoplanes bogorensis TaxID=1610840 RepID=A0ABS5YMV5_9ACTN|nr:hypothetical protein [Actinoplanes bogorensis]MBU2664777.1 hypothetical protein [Actinoplanes bogorensis]